MGDNVYPGENNYRYESLTNLLNRTGKGDGLVFSVSLLIANMSLINEEQKNFATVHGLMAKSIDIQVCFDP